MNLMKHVALILALSYFFHCAAPDEAHQKEVEKEIEKEFRDAFKSAFSKRSDEIGQFFNETFGQGGNASDIAERFKTAWQGASEGVRSFVNETYWNISRIMEGDNSSVEATAGVTSMDFITAGIEKGAKDAKHQHQRKDKEQKVEEDDSAVTRAWNYFKSVFGVTNSNESGPQVSASIPVSPPQSSSAGNFFLGLVTLAASVILVVQTTFNRNSLANKQMYRSEPTREVPSGYVRIESF